MSDSATPNAKLSIDGGGPDRMHHHSQWSSPCDPIPLANARHVGRQASSAGYGYDQSSSTHPSDPNDNGMNFAIVKRFTFNQRVNVNIEGRGWLVGTVVAILTAVKSLTGSRVRVKYSAPHDYKERMAEVPDDPRFIRPL